MLPADRSAEVKDFADFVRERATRRKKTTTDRETLDFPVISVEKWPEDLSLCRADVYGDDGR